MRASWQPTSASFRGCRTPTKRNIGPDHQTRDQAGAHDADAVCADRQRYSPYLKRYYEKIKSRRGRGKAIIALARKFLGIIYRTLKNNWVFEDFPNFVLAEASLICKPSASPLSLLPMFQNGPRRPGFAPVSLFKSAKDFPQPRTNRAPLTAPGRSEDLPDEKGKRANAKTKPFAVCGSLPASRWSAPSCSIFLE